MSLHRSEPTGILEWRIERPSPVLAIAMHAGHDVRPELLERMAAPEAARLTEEDPGTDRLLDAFPVAIRTDVSRFEVDINRPRARAAYTTPETCWGIQLYRELPTDEQLEASRRRHDEAWAAIDRLVDDAVERFGFCVLLDVHSYCYRRDDPSLSWWDSGKPVFNLGTRGTHPRFAALNTALLDALRPQRWAGRPVTVGENVIFGGGTVHRRQQARHPDRVVVPSLELLKVFMDELTGEVYEPGFTAMIEQTSQAWVAVLDRLPELLPDLAGEPGFSWR